MVGVHAGVLGGAGGSARPSPPITDGDVVDLDSGLSVGVQADITNTVRWTSLPRGSHSRCQTNSAEAIISGYPVNGLCITRVEQPELGRERGGSQFSHSTCNLYPCFSQTAYGNVKELRRTTAFGGRCKYIAIFLEQVATHVLTPNLEVEEAVLVRRLTIDQPSMSVARTLSSIAQWVTKIHYLSHHANGQSFRDGGSACYSPSWIESTCSAGYIERHDCQPIISALVLPSGGMPVGHRKVLQLRHCFISTLHYLRVPFLKMNIIDSTQLFRTVSFSQVDENELDRHWLGNSRSSVNRNKSAGVTCAYFGRFGSTKLPGLHGHLVLPGLTCCVELSCDCN
ncbi:hypothetical protein CSKR_107623 [Clonorchis sinensis]|uniref:Uncharacterized protein n=1 Tax=Clonorchis sinensis TaxID=79923 RepID=A0A3R7H1Q0_CLOSI|nr:hypothetical protein CSKR_107623 [Clonorchis sinensis]